MAEQEDVGRIKRTIYCGGLGEHASVANFQITFAPFGEIKTIEVPTDHVTGAPRGFGFIEFEEREDALAGNFIENQSKAMILKFSLDFFYFFKTL